MINKLEQQEKEFQNLIVNFFQIFIIFYKKKK